MVNVTKVNQPSKVWGSAWNILKPSFDFHPEGVESRTSSPPKNSCSTLQECLDSIGKPKFRYETFGDTVDGRNPAPPGMYKTTKIMGYLPYQLVQDFLHQEYLQTSGPQHFQEKTISPPWNLTANRVKNDGRL